LCGDARECSLLELGQLGDLHVAFGDPFLEFTHVSFESINLRGSWSTILPAASRASRRRLCQRKVRHGDAAPKDSTSALLDGRTSAAFSTEHRNSQSQAHTRYHPPRPSSSTVEPLSAVLTIHS
jgi:hypothetical protein